MITNTHEFPEHKVLYVEVPKAGCTSVKWALRHLRGKWEGQPDAAFHEWFGYHQIYSSSIVDVLRSKYQDWTVFTVVRNPIDRFASLYRNIRRASRDWKGEHCETISDFVRNLPKSGWFEDVHGRPQTKIIGEDLSVYNHIGKTEDLERTEFFLSSRFGCDIQFSRENRSGSLGESLSDSELNTLGNIFERDYKVLGYDKP